MQPRQTKVYKRRRTVTDSYYRTQFRFTRPSVQWITAEFLGPDTGERRGGALTNLQKMEITLRYMADPGFMNGLSEVVGVSQPTVSRTVKEVVAQICNRAAVWIKFPNTQVEIENAARAWQLTRNFPMAFAVVDGSLFKVQKPRYNLNPQEYYTGRKKFHAINAQIICDGQYRILDAYIARPGSVHDARVWRNSPVKAFMDSGISGDKLILADSGYGIAPYLMTPYPRAESATDPIKSRFNTALSHDRVVVENTLGQLKNQFQMLRVTIRLSLEEVPKFILACCILHNVGIHLGDVFEDDPDLEGDYVTGDDGQGVIPSGAGASAVRAAGQTKRDQIAAIL